MDRVLALKPQSQECNWASHFQSLCCTPWPAFPTVRPPRHAPGGSQWVSVARQVWEALGYSGLLPTRPSEHLSPSGPVLAAADIPGWGDRTRGCCRAGLGRGLATLGELLGDSRLSQA